MEKANKNKKDTSIKTPVKTEKPTNTGTKKNCLEKKSVDHSVKKFAIISPESIKTTAEAVGISEISEEAIAGLSEDVSYKLREIVHNCCVLIHNTKRRKLLTEDVNRVFETANTPVVHGHSVAHGLDFVHIPKADVYVENDTEVDIVAMSALITAFTKPGEEYVKGNWLLPDPAEKELKEEPKVEPGTSSNAGSAQASKPPGSGDQTTLSKPPPHFINYYLQVARVVIGGSEPHLKVALADLRRNSKIGPLVPYFLNLVALSVNKLQRNGRLTDALLRTVEALVDNPYVDPSSQIAVNRAVNALLVVAIEPKAAKNCDDLFLRHRSAQLLAKVLSCWSIELKQQMDIVRQLLQLLLDENISVKSHYGAVVSVTALGQRTLDSYFWPILDRYIAVLEKHKTSPTDAQDVQFVKGAILIAVEKMYKRRRNQLSAEDIKRRQRVEHRLYEFLGDALVPRFNLRSSELPLYPGKWCAQTETDCTEQQTDFILRETLIKSYSSQTLYPFQPEVRGTMPKLHMYSVFSLSPCAFKQPKPIVFNFIGSSQKNSALLKRRKIGELLQKEFKSNHYRFAQIWRIQNSVKKTRTIKYCLPTYSKSSVGDLFGFL